MVVEESRADRLLLVAGVNSQDFEIPSEVAQSFRILRQLGTCGLKTYQVGRDSVTVSIFS